MARASWTARVWLVTGLATGGVGCPSEPTVCLDGTSPPEGETCREMCPPLYTLVDGKCVVPRGGDPCAPVDCSGAPPVPGVVRFVPQALDPATCVCVPGMCEDGWTSFAGTCIRDDSSCAPGERREGGICAVNEVIGCWEGNAYALPTCVKGYCFDHPTADDGTDLEAIGKCVVDPPPPSESCTDGCHEGTSHPHAVGGALSCTDCHGGDPTGNQREVAHVALPVEWSQGSTSWGRPNLRYYYNYLTLTGVESFEGGLEWLRFRNPSDLRVADQTCGRDSGCHRDRVENVRRSVMATAVGLVGVAQARSGIPRTILREGDGIYQWDTTEGVMSGASRLDAIQHDPEFTGSVESLERFEITERSPIGTYDQIAILREIYDKACGDCHLGSGGRNDRYGDFRSSGCAACHMPYALDGASDSNDPMIPKDEPTYPNAFVSIANFDVTDLENLNGRWLGPERSHPIDHRLGVQMSSVRCGTCHSGSNRTDWQFRGYQIDPNETVRQAFEAGLLDADQFDFTDELPDNPFARFRGLAQQQILRMVDWDDDGLDDIPADVHFSAGLECMDCHTSGEMHNELKFVKVRQVTDWADRSQVADMSGAIWSHMDQATEIECTSCHGTLEHRALSYELDNRNPVRNLLVCPEPDEVIEGDRRPPACAQLGNGRWLRSKFTGRYHYVPQTRDTVEERSAVRPNGAPVYTLEASIFHGRVNDDASDGVGPCAGGDPGACLTDQRDPSTWIEEGFSHLGAPSSSPVDQHAGGLECYACHATWANMCFGCHLRLADTDGNQSLRDFSRSTGQLTLGAVVEADFTYVSPRDVQLGINSEGKIAQLVPESKQQIAHTDANNQQFFGTHVILNDDANVEYNVYRDRAGYGTRQYATELVGLPFPSAGFPAEQFPQMDDNAGQGANQMVPHTTQRASPAMDCVTSGCHVSVGESNAGLATARWMANPRGFGGSSAYLDVLGGLGQIRRHDSQAAVFVMPERGFLLGDPAVEPDPTVSMQTDYCVRRQDGFPLCSNNHPAKRAAGTPQNPPWETRYARPFPTFAPVAGPLNASLLNRVLDVRVADEGIRYAGPR